MAHYSKLFEKVPMEVQNSSGFDLSHENLFTAKVGTLVPAFVYDCIPNTKLSLRVSSQIQLPPMATDFYGKVDAVFESFFVPYRLLYGGWQELITHEVNTAVYPDGTLDSQKAKYLPYFNIPSGSYGAGSLADYLGVKVTQSSGDLKIQNPFRFLAYHLIYDCWYRNSFIQPKLFVRQGSTNVNSVSTLPYKSFSGDSPRVFIATFSGSAQDAGINNGTVYDLRQRNWAKDYFTSSTPLPQAGLPAKYEFEIFGPEQIGEGNYAITPITWSDISAMNSLQRFNQRNNIAGYRYSDQIYARFGCLPPDAIMDRPVYLGRTIIPVYNKSVYQTNTSSANLITGNNPFASVGAKYGSPMGVGNGMLIDKFHAKEHGVFMTLFSLVPRAYYSSGTHRTFAQNHSTDFPDPDFAHLGDQPIYSWELTNATPQNYQDEGTFGYQSRDSHYKYIDDQVHGLLRDGESLESFALQRSFSAGSSPDLSSDFLEIPTNFLDQVSAVDSSVSDYGCWVDCFFNCKASMPLPASSIPTLTDPKDVHTIMVNKGGRTL